MNTYAKSADSYIVQRVMGTSAEQQAGLLLEAGQLFLGKAMVAMQKRDVNEERQCLIRVTDIINESICRLNYENGGELVENLLKLYDWWIQEIMSASRTRDTGRLGRVSSHMGEIRRAWEQFHEKHTQVIHASELQLRDQIV